MSRNFEKMMEEGGQFLKSSKKVAFRMGEGAAWMGKEGSKKMANVAGKGLTGMGEFLKSDPSALKEIFTLKNVARTAAFSGSMYGLSAVLTDSSENSASDRMIHYSKHAVGGAVDAASDLTLGAVGGALATFGGLPGAIVGGGIMAYNFLGGFFGADTGSIAMNAMNQLEERYDADRQGPQLKMTENTSMALQRQLSNLHASGSNIAETMHN